MRRALKRLQVRADWNHDAKVWAVTATDVPGLAGEADTLEALAAKLETVAPQILEANGYLPVTAVELVASIELGYRPSEGARLTNVPL